MSFRATLCAPSHPINHSARIARPPSAVQTTASTLSASCFASISSWSTAQFAEASPQLRFDFRLRNQQRTEIDTLRLRLDDKPSQQPLAKEDIGSIGVHRPIGQIAERPETVEDLTAPRLQAECPGGGCGSLSFVDDLRVDASATKVTASVNPVGPAPMIRTAAARISHFPSR
jgi:hypothetical protein